MNVTDFITERKRSYQLAFQSLDSPVMKDLARFCRANATCVVPGNSDLTLILEGRREVYLRIKDHVERSVEELIEAAKPARVTYQGDSDA